MEIQFADLLAEYGLIGMVLLSIITGQLVPKIYYVKVVEENQKLRESLEKSMELNQAQSETIASYKKRSGGGE